VALVIALRADVRTVGAIDDVLRVALPLAAFWVVCGFGLVRLLLPAELRRDELLWVMPVGAVASAVALAALGYAYVPFAVSLAVVALAGLALGVVAVRRRGLPARPAPRRVAWPAFVAVLAAAIVLVPLFRAGMLTVVGYGSDAHLAAGTGEFLQHHHPLAYAPETAVDRVPLVWRSKPPIYYELAAGATLAGRPTFAVLSVVQALLLFMGVLGAFLVSRRLLDAPGAFALAGAGIVGIDRIVVFTVMHPYYNQTWGLFAMFWSLVAGWAWLREPRRLTVVLPLLFLLIVAFAYPLALPIPVVVLGLAWLLERRARRARGEEVRTLGLGRRPWLIIPLLLVLVPAVFGVGEKLWTGFRVAFDPSMSLAGWGGDLFHYVPEATFLGLPIRFGWPVVAVALAGFAVLALRRLPRSLAIGYGAILVLAALAAAWFRLRDSGQYFHFKALAFVAPLLILAAVAGMAQLRGRWRGVVGVVLACLYAGAAARAAQVEVRDTFDETPRGMQELRAWDAALPPSASIRLDTKRDSQLWLGYMLKGQPLCSLWPLTGTSYPHVVYARRATYVLAPASVRRPLDTIGRPVRRNEDWALWRMRPITPGPGGCSRRAVLTVTEIK
jgi:hypothetical protein